MENINYHRSLTWRCLLPLLLSAFCLYWPSTGSTAESTTLIPQAIISITDGDTFTVDLMNCPDVVCRRIPVRIDGIDTPEMRSRCPAEKAKAQQAKQHLVGRLRSGQNVELRNVARDKYFRLRAELWVGGINVGNELLALGLARPYHGEKRQPWCTTPVT